MSELRLRFIVAVGAPALACIAACIGASPAPPSVAQPSGPSIERHDEPRSTATAPESLPTIPVSTELPEDSATPIAIRPSAAEMTQRQWNNVASVDGASCRADLTRAGFRFTPVVDVAAPDKKGCGVPHGVVVARGPTGILYSPPLFVDCSLARELVDIERIVQEEADRHLGVPIARIATLGTFACRHRRGRWEDTMSEHSFGDAADLASFEPRKGRVISVARDYELGKADPSARASFLRAVYARLRDETKLTFVLGPEFNPEHRDHFHIDRGYRWW